MIRHYAGMRHELKLMISNADYVALSSVFSAILKHDEYAVNGSDYFIRSLYFDDIYNSSYEDKINGTDNRKKFRIRIYNNSPELIKLESKEKHGSRIKKTSSGIGRKIYDDCMSGIYEPLLSVDSEMAKEAYALFRAKLLSPSVIVEYDREAYVHPLSNTRLTFDKHLHAGIGSFDIFDENMPTIPVFPNGSVIFEIKYDDYIPAYITDIIKTVTGHQIALSKFCICRNILTEVNFNALNNKAAGNNFNTVGGLL